MSKEFEKGIEYVAENLRATLGSQATNLWIESIKDKVDILENDIVKILKSLVYEDKYKEVTSLITKLDEEFAELKSSQIKKIKDKLSAQYILQQYIDLEVNK